jgi:hypothetical protein
MQIDIAPDSWLSWMLFIPAFYYVGYFWLRAVVIAGFAVRDGFVYLLKMVAWCVRQMAALWEEATA